MSKAFDSDDLLNEDGTVTITMSPSQWRNYNIAPDTYHLFTTEHFENNEIQYASEVSGQDDLDYDDFDWEYDHSTIVREISETIADVIVERLRTALNPRPQPRSSIHGALTSTTSPLMGLR